MKIKTLSRLLVLAALPFALLASPATDRAIETATRGSYNFRVVLNDVIQTSAKNGVLTLTGSVEDQSQKDLATNTAMEVKGVKSVNNELTLRSFYKENSDGWIAFKTRASLLVKAKVSASDTTVTVNKGIVTLGGTADTLAQKELTALYAGEINGVKSVNNTIVVGPRPSTVANVAEFIDDASITSSVKYALLSHKSTRALTTTVTTTDGNVMITGLVGSDAEKSLVTKLAQDVRGTKKVSNKMTIGT